jgi:hypothetical protein
MYYVGWREKLQDNSPLAPCYKISIPVAGPADDSCESDYTSSGDDRPTTQFMRVGTVYGFCGATYVRDGNIIFQVPHRRDKNYQDLVDRSSCTIAQ